MCTKIVSDNPKEAASYRNVKNLWSGGLSVRWCVRWEEKPIRKKQKRFYRVAERIKQQTRSVNRIFQVGVLQLETELFLNKGV
jgi:hypothetical protein